MLTRYDKIKYVAPLSGMLWIIKVTSRSVLHTKFDWKSSQEETPNPPTRSLKLHYGRAFYRGTPLLGI
jgi:hypothetical protein